MTDYSAEQWKPIPGFALYEASDCGRIRISPSEDGKFTPYILLLQMGTRGYLKCGATSDDGVRKTRNVHTLIADAFLPPPVPGQVLVRHLNDIKTDNRLDNLARGSARDNKEDAKRNGRLPLGARHPSAAKPWTRPRGATHSAAKLTEADIREIMVSVGKQRDVAEVYGVNQALIQRIRTGKVWKHITNPEWIAKEVVRQADEEAAELIIQAARVKAKQRATA